MRDALCAVIDKSAQSIKCTCLKLKIIFVIIFENWLQDIFKHSRIWVCVPQVRIEDRLDRLASRQEEDEELFRRILSSLMSSEENERVSGVPVLLFFNLKCITLKSLAGVGTVIKLASPTTSASDTFVPWANLNICVYPVSYIIIHSAVINLAYACTA